MGFDFPVNGRRIGSPEVQNFQPDASEEAGENPFVRTAEKTNLFGKQLGGSKKEASRTLDDLSARIVKLKKEWDEMSPEDLAESIIDLEDRVAILGAADSPQIAKIAEQVKHLHFQYVFPIVQELSLEDSGGEEQIPFAQHIHQVAGEIIQQNSLAPFSRLTDLQQREVMRYALIGRSE